MTAVLIDTVSICSALADSGQFATHQRQQSTWSTVQNSQSRPLATVYPVNMTHQQTVVLDIGDRQTKIGYSGQLLPLRVIPTTMYHNQQPVTHATHCTQLSYVQWYAVLLTYTKYLYYNVLCCTHTVQQVLPRTIVILHADYTDAYKYALLTALHTLRVHSVYCMDSAVCSTVASACNSALVVDIGHYNTRIMPVYHFTPVILAQQLIDVGMQHCIDALTAVASHSATDGDKQAMIDTLNTNNNAERVILQHCYLRTDSGQHDTDDRMIHLSTTCDIQLTHQQRSNMCESLFNSNVNSDKATESVTEGILNCLLLCDNHVRANCSQNIVLCGGTAAVQNLPSRLHAELQQLLLNDIRYTKIKHLSSKLCLNGEQPVASSLVAWTGASLYETLNGNTLQYTQAAHTVTAHHTLDVTHKPIQEFQQRCQCDELGQVIDLYRRTGIVQY